MTKPTRARPPVGYAASILIAWMIGCGGRGSDVHDEPSTQVSGTSSDRTCIPCHLADFKAARHHQKDQPSACGHCHTENSFHGTIKRDKKSKRAED